MGKEIGAHAQRISMLLLRYHHLLFRRRNFLPPPIIKMTEEGVKRIHL